MTTRGKPTVDRRRFLQVAGAASALPINTSLVALSAEPANAPADVARARAVTERVLLLVDDHHVLYQSGAKRVLQPLERHPGNPLIRGKEKPWEVAIAWTSVYRNPQSGRYQLWYQAFAGSAAREKTHRCTVCYAESDDGIHWHKPALGLHQFNGIKDTNIVLLANGGTSDRYGASVVVDRRDSNPARRYKMTYFDFATQGGKEYPGMCVAFSPDGIHWTKHTHAPVLRAAYGNIGGDVTYGNDPARSWDIPLSISDATDVFYDPRLGVFAVYGKMWIDGPDGRMFWKHAACRTQSKDFMNWERPQLVLAPDDLDPSHVEFHTTPVFYHQGCYFAAPQILNRDVRGGIMDIELALSCDGLHFERPFRAPFWLSRSDGEKFDSGSLFTNSSPVVLRDEIRFYYGGYSQGATGADDSYQLSGIGLATLRRDRFVAREPVDSVAQLTLKPLDLANVQSMTLNADATGGQILPELLDERGYRVRGFSRDDAAPIAGDSLDHEILWKGKGLNELPTGRYMLRLLLDSAKVFSVTLHP